jgi:hypothetical protein
VPSFASSVGHDPREAAGDRVVDWERVKVRSTGARVCSYAGGGVSGYTRQEVAQRAGVDPDYVDRLVELGILTPAVEDGCGGRLLAR